jgi:hypothetical protein
MPINPSWYSNGVSDPFRDNTDGSITAQTLRNFAGELRDNGVAEDWCIFRSFSIDESLYDWTDVDTPVLVGVTSPVQGGSASLNWSFNTSSDPKNWALFTYTAFSSNSVNTRVVLDFSFQSTIAYDGVDPNWGKFGSFTGFTDGTKIQPVVFVGSGENVGNLYRVMGEQTIDLAEDPTPYFTIQNNTFRTYYTGANAPVIKVGVLLTPASGEALEDSAIDVDLSNLEVRIAARTISPAD